MNPWHDVIISTETINHFNCLIEIPMGSKIKYELHKESGLLKVDRILYSSVHYPCNYGFFPQTYAMDDDPLDVLVIGQLPVTPLSIMRVRPIGVIRMIDQGQQDDKILSIHIDDPEFNHIKTLKQIPAHRLREIKNFFEHYKELEQKDVFISSIGDEREALDVIQDAIDLYPKFISKKHPEQRNLHA
jgi:inorganic pyrophosphatase